MARKVRAQALFHDRAAMEHAVRALTLEGVRPRRIHVDRARVEGDTIRTPRGASSPVSAGAAVGSAIGGAVAIVSLVAAGGALPLFDLVARLAGVAGLGALAGAIAVLLVRRARRAPEPAHYDDFLLRVDARDDATAARLRDLLALAGGDPLPT